MANRTGKGYQTFDPDEIHALLALIPGLEGVIEENKLLIAEDGRLMIPDPWQEGCPTDLVKAWSNGRLTTSRQTKVAHRIVKTR